jgi:hypothetical protein
MNKLTALLLFASMLAASCSSTYRRGPSIDVGDNRIAINGSMSDRDYTKTNDSGPIGDTVNTSSIDIDLTLGRVVAENFELGGILIIQNTTTTVGLDEGSDDTLAMGAYGRYYLPGLMLQSRNMVPWVQGAILFTGSHEISSTTSTENSELFGVEFGVGVTHFLSKDAAIEFALTRTSLEYSNFSGSTAGIADEFDGQVDEVEGTTFSVGLSLNF